MIIISSITIIVITVICGTVKKNITQVAPCEAATYSTELFIFSTSMIQAPGIPRILVVKVIFLLQVPAFLALKQQSTIPEGVKILIFFDLGF